MTVYHPLIHMSAVTFFNRSSMSRRNRMEKGKEKTENEKEWDRMTFSASCPILVFPNSKINIENKMPR